MVNGNCILSLSHLTDYIATAPKTGVQQLWFVFAKLEMCKPEDNGVTQLDHFDQANQKKFSWKISRNVQISNYGKK